MGIIKDIPIIAKLRTQLPKTHKNNEKAKHVEVAHTEVQTENGVYIFVPKEVLNGRDGEISTSIQINKIAEKVSQNSQEEKGKHKALKKLFRFL